MTPRGFSMSDYVLEGPRWSSGLITWSFADQTYPNDGATPFTASVGSDYQSTVRAAFQAWASVANLQFENVPDSADPGQAADIRVGFGTFSDSRAIGQTNFSTQGGRFVPDVLIRLQDPGIEPLVANADGSFTYSGYSSQLYQIVLHEIGHALGLGHTTDPNAIMYPVAQPSNRTLDATDIAGIQALYGAPTRDAAIPGTHTSYLVAPAADLSLVVQPAIGGPVPVAPGARVLHFTDGTGYFDPTGTAEEVTRLYHAAFGRGAGSGELDYWAGQIDSGALAPIDAARAFVGSAEFGARFGQLSDSQFVAAVFQDALGRPADGGSLQFWSGRLAAGDDRGGVLLGIAQSEESKRHWIGIAGDRDDAEIGRLYQAALGRAPEAGADQYWSAALDGGGSLTQLAQDFVGSAEFAQKYGAPGNAGYVGLLYQNVLHRPGDPGGVQYWTQALQSGASRANVLASFANSTENRVDTATATHDGWVWLG